jgi:hypothetical protein
MAEIESAEPAYKTGSGPTNTGLNPRDNYLIFNATLKVTA